MTLNNVTSVRYGQYDLTAYLLGGDFVTTSSSGRFSVLDDDGFLTLAALMSGWQSAGKAQLNASSPVRLTNNEAALILAVARAGQAYQRAVLRVLEETPVAQRTASHDDQVQVVQAHEAFMAILERQITVRVNNAPARSAITVETGYLAQNIGAYLNRFAPKTTRRYLAQYTDGQDDTDAPSILCDREVASPVVGPLLCSRNYVTHADRDPAFCPDGLFISEVAAARSCQGRLDGSQAIASECTTGFAGTR